MGQNVAVVGNYVNNWKVDAPLWLTTDASSYPRWTSAITRFEFTDENIFEYKYIIKQVSGKYAIRNDVTINLLSRVVVFNGNLVKIEELMLKDSRLGGQMKSRLSTRHSIRLMSLRHWNQLERSKSR